MQGKNNFLAGCFALGIALYPAILPSASFSQSIQNSQNPQAPTILIADSSPIGNSVQVLWRGTWYDAKIIDTSGGKYKITYDGYDSSWDEFVTIDRIQWKTGNSIQVYWKGKWYDARIIGVKGGRYKITYEGYDSSWDEFVDASRIR